MNTSERSIDINLHQANEFLTALGHKDNQHTFQTFDDNSDRKDRQYARIFHGTFDEHQYALAALNQHGAGVFVTVNQTDGLGRTKEHITDITAIWQDDDDGFKGDYPIPPNITVQSSPGKYQRYWLVERDMTIEQHRQVMERMVKSYGADNGAKDRARVLRLPGYYHCKGVPVRVEIIGEINPVPYSVNQILDSFPPVTGSAKQTKSVNPSKITDLPVGARNSGLTAYAGKLWNAGIDGEDLIAALRARNGRLTEPLPDSEIISICDSAERNFDPVKDPDSLIKEMNQKYAVLSLRGKIRIMHEHIDEYGHTSQDFLTKSDFQLKCANLPSIQTEKGSVSAAQYWMTNPDRREYTGLTFNPRSTPSNYFNLWTGFSIEPSEGDCSLFLDHCLNVVCNGNHAHFTYLMSWLAHLVQDPDVKIGVAVILRGLKGTGKGVFMNTIGALFGKHYTLISQQRHLTGNFNAHLAETLLLGGDEITWGGDIKGEGPLKSLITEDWVMLERKGIDAIRVPSFMRLIICTNSDWSVPASADERRYFVLDVSDRHKQDFKYFSSIKKQMDDGGMEALLHFLLHFEIPQEVELRDPPRTEGLNDQVIQSLKPVELWWFECLRARTIKYPHHLEESHYSLMTSIERVYLDDITWWGSEIKCKDGVIHTEKSGRLNKEYDLYDGMKSISIENSTLTNAFLLYARKGSDKAHSASTTVGIMLKKLYPGIKSGEMFNLPDLTVLRHRFEKKVLGYEYEWDWKTSDCSPIDPGVCNLDLGSHKVVNALAAYIMQLEEPS